MGWFFGFKLYRICNECGKLLNFMITPGDVDDRKPHGYKAFVEFIYRKLVGDKGYIGKNLFESLSVDGIQLITRLKSKMKGALMSLLGRRLLRRRPLSKPSMTSLRTLRRWNTQDTGGLAILL